MQRRWGVKALSSNRMDVKVNKKGGHPNVAKAGGLESQGAKGAAVVVYCKPLATPDLKSSGFPAG
jgi:hypothetical protein